MDNLQLSWVREKRFPECSYKQKLPFDIFIPDFNIIIEFDGLHHFKKCHYYDENFILRDLIKTLYASKYYFLRVSYEEMGILDQLITQFVTDVINENIPIGFYYNYLSCKLSDHILCNYDLHNQCTLENINDMKSQILQNFG